MVTKQTYLRAYTTIRRRIDALDDTISYEAKHGPTCSLQEADMEASLQRWKRVDGDGLL